MRQENTMLSGKMAENRAQQCWDAFCETGSVSAYLQYRKSCRSAEGAAYADTSDGQGTGHP